MAIPGWAIDGDATGLKFLAQGVDIVHPVGQMAEVAAAGVFLWVPVVGQFDHGRLVFPGPRFVFRGGEEHQGEAAFSVALTADFYHTQQIAEEVQRVVQVAHPDHGVQVLHKVLLGWLGSELCTPQFTVFFGYD